MSKRQTDSLKPPPYLPFPSFKTGLKALVHDGELPAQVDSSVVSSMSGGTQRAFFSALRFFQLLDDDSHPTKSLQELAGALDRDDAESWKRLLADLIQTFYPDQQLVTLAKSTPSALIKSFEDLVGATMIAPACRFMVSASKEAGLPVAPHIAKHKWKSASRQRRQKRAENDRTGGEDVGVREATNDSVPPESLRHALLDKYPDFDPSWGSEIQQSWFEGYRRLMDMMEGEN